VATTVRQLIAGALRRIGYLDPQEPLTAQDGRDCAGTFNALLASLPRKRLDYEHVAVTLNTAFPLGTAPIPPATSPKQIGEDLVEGLKAILALRLTDDYAPEADTPRLRVDANSGWAALRGALLVIPTSQFDLPRDEHLVVSTEEET
jgi:hypothetical protein